MKSFTTKIAFDPSLFVDIRKRLGAWEFDNFNKLIIEKAEHIKPHRSRIKVESSGTDKNDDELAQSEHPNKGTQGIFEHQQKETKKKESHP